MIESRLDIVSGLIDDKKLLLLIIKSLKDVIDILSLLTGVRAPKVKMPRGFVLPLAHVNKWIADYITHEPPRIPLEGVRMAKYMMH